MLYRGLVCMSIVIVVSFVKIAFECSMLFTVFTPRTLPFFTPLPSLSLLENYYLSIEISINLKKKGCSSEVITHGAGLIAQWENHLPGKHKAPGFQCCLIYTYIYIYIIYFIEH